MPDWALLSGQCRSLFIFHTFLYFEEKSQRKTVVLEGNNVTKEKMNSTSSLMGLGAHSGFQLSRAAPPLPSPPTVLCKRFGSKKLVYWVSRCLPCFPVTHILFLALKEKDKTVGPVLQFCRVISY